jgi:hypothetical protein
MFDQKSVIKCNFIKPSRTNINTVLDSSPAASIGAVNFGSVQSTTFYVGFRAVSPLKQLKRACKQRIQGDLV